MPSLRNHLAFADASAPPSLACISFTARCYVVEKQARLGINSIDKLDFVEAFPQACERTSQAETIRNNFAGTGLIPFNPDRVLSQLNIRLKNPTLSPSRSTNSASKMPYTTRKLNKQASTA